MSDSRSLFRRCVQCPPEPPSCPACASDETCSLNAQSCNACASTSCVRIGTLPGQLATKSSTPVGPIAGGVVGGVVAVAIAAFLFYYFHVKRRKSVETWDPPEKRDQSMLHRGERQTNTRSAHSIASTVQTRASNVIQIAYIPGVTTPESPGLAVPPVPSIPAVMGVHSTSSSPQVEQHFFMPGDLRDSTWSDGSSMMDPRISIAPSLARNSVATTMYRDSAIVPPIPAQHAQMARPNVVSVKSRSSTPSASSNSKVQTPSVPQLPKMGLGNTSIVIQNAKARPIEVKKTASAPKVPTLGNLAREASKKTKDQAESSQDGSAGYYDEKEVVLSPVTVIEDSLESPMVKARPSYGSMLSGHSSAVSAIMPSTGPLGSSNGQPVHRHTASTGLTAMIEDAINRAARDPAHTGLGHSSSRPELKQNVSTDSGPFSDSNELKENVI